MKQQVMKKAWKIRKTAALEMGCKVSEVCFSICLRMAWKQVRSAGAITYTWGGYESSRSWAARITGTCPRYGLSRNFQRVEKSDFSGSGKTFKCSIEIKEGEVFQISNGYKKRFVSCVNGAAYWLEESEVKAMF